MKLTECRRSCCCFCTCFRVSPFTIPIDSGGLSLGLQHGPGTSWKCNQTPSQQSVNDPAVGQITCYCRNLKRRATRPCADRGPAPFLNRLQQVLLGLDSLTMEETCDLLKAHWPVCHVLTMSATRLYNCYCWFCDTRWKKTKKLRTNHGMEEQWKQ